MSMSLGEARIDITANLAPLRKGLATAKKVASKFGSNYKRMFASIRKSAVKTATFMKTSFKVAFASMKRAASSMFRLIKSGFRKLVSLSKLVVVSLVGIGIASVKIASDVRETDNLFKISMGSMAGQAATFAREYSKSLNLFENDTRKALSTFQLMLTSMGIAEDESFAMSKGLTRLVNDIASFRNQKPEEVFLKLQAGITGESEPLKRLGILVNETTIKHLALSDATIMARMSMKGAKKELTQVEKVMLRYRAILNATGKDQNDMARTLNETANVFRQLWAQVKNTADTIGKALLPVVTDVGVAVRDWLVGNQGQFDSWANTAASAIEAVVAKIREYFDLASNGDSVNIFKDLTSIFNKAAVALQTGIQKAIDLIAPHAKTLGKLIANGAINEGIRAIGVIAGLLANALLAALKAIMPIFVTVGEQIAKGFMVAVKDTKLGKGLGAAWKVGKAVTAPARFLGRTIGSIAAPFANHSLRNEGRRVERLGGQFRTAASEARSSGRDVTGRELLQEIRLQNQMLKQSMGGSFNE
jgi:hypothetical protein